ncbi:MAG: leucine-rich repeat domain-containing protein [Solirubrobacterales bacterium]
MCKWRCALALLLFLWGSSRAQGPVYIADPRLKEVIEGELWTVDPSAEDMLGLTSLTIRSAGISSLTGLEYAVNLRSLDLRENQITSVEPLSGLTNLESLNLSMNKIGSILSLSALTELTMLDVHDNHDVSDISSLSGMTKMQSLTLRHNTISDISALSGMSDLRHVDLFENQIADISSLAGKTHLSYVDLRSNPLDGDACTTYISQILANNTGVEFRYDRCGPSHIVLSATVGGTIVSPGVGEFEYTNGEVLWLQAQAYPGYTFAGWSGSTTGTSNPMRYTIQGDQQIRANFISQSDELYVDDDAAGDPKPGDAQAGDPDEDGTVDHPFDSIQEAIAVAKGGASIFVRPGTYRENLDLLGKKIHVSAIDPNDPNSGPCAIVEGRGAGPVVRISAGGGTQCGLSGLVLTKGDGLTVGAIYCSGSSPVLSHLLIVGNRCSDADGAALYFSDSRAVLAHCTVAGNYAGSQGAGLVLEDSNVAITNSIFWGNYPSEIRTEGQSDPSILYCNVRGWWPDIGNTHSNPLFADPGYWAVNGDPDTTCEPQDSRATWIDGDYHLQSQAGRWDRTAQAWVCDAQTSPAIDAGDPAGDIGFEPMPNGGIVNMGVYGGTSEAGMSP